MSEIDELDIYALEEAFDGNPTHHQAFVTIGRVMQMIDRIKELEADRDAQYRAYQMAMSGLNKSDATIQALREALGQSLEAMKIVQSGNYGTCPVVSDPKHQRDGPEVPCPRCGDLGWFSFDKEYDPDKDGNCINDGAQAILKAPIRNAARALAQTEPDNA